MYIYIYIYIYIHTYIHIHTCTYSSGKPKAIPLSSGIISKLLKQISTNNKMQKNNSTKEETQNFRFY